MEHNPTPGTLVLTARTARRLKQEEAAALLGMTRGRLSAIENDQAKDPRASEIEALRAHFDISPEIWGVAAPEAAP